MEVKMKVACARCANEIDFDSVTYRNEEERNVAVEFIEYSEDYLLLHRKEGGVCSTPTRLMFQKIVEEDRVLIYDTNFICVSCGAYGK